jgi:CIC family chloride channel protein
VGSIAGHYAPFPIGAPGAYALVGMGTLFAGIIRAPMTSVFMIFEITQDYQIIVPLMVANMISLVISSRYQRDPVYHALLAQEGVVLPHAPRRRVPEPAAAGTD